MRKLATILMLVALCVTAMWADDDRAKELDRIKAAQNVLSEIMAAPDKGIPEEILGSADCVAVVPSMLKGGFVFGGRYGKGVATCRTTGDHWSAPVPIRIEGGSWGLQIGGQAVDLTMVVMNRKGMDQLLQSKFKLGADVSAAAGPVGRHVEGTTDWKMRAQVLTYSRARGAFAGATLNGAVLKQDADDTVLLYGKQVPYTTILSGKAPDPKGTEPFVAEVARYFRESRAHEVGSKAPTSGTSGERSTTARSESTPTASTGTAATSSQPTASSSQNETTGGTANAATQPPASSTQTGTTGSVAGNERMGTQSTTSSALPGTQQSGAQAGTSGSVSANAQAGTQSGSTTTTETTPSGANAAAGSSDQVKSNIETALHQSPGVSTNNVSVTVTDNQVVLAGSVPTQRDKLSIRRIAEQNAGGRTVVDNDLIVK